VCFDICGWFFLVFSATLTMTLKQWEALSTNRSSPQAHTCDFETSETLLYYSAGNAKRFGGIMEFF
jgi:hypothetical protein